MLVLGGEKVDLSAMSVETCSRTVWEKVVTGMSLIVAVRESREHSRREEQRRERQSWGSRGLQIL